MRSKIYAHIAVWDFWPNAHEPFIVCRVRVYHFGKWHKTFFHTHKTPVTDRELLSAIRQRTDADTLLLQPSLDIPWPVLSED